MIAYLEGIADFNYPEFIYPYRHNYDDIKPTCASCSFKEVEDLTEFFKEEPGSELKFIGPLNQQKNESMCPGSSLEKPCKVCDDLDKVFYYVRKIQ